MEVKLRSSVWIWHKKKHGEVITAFKISIGKTNGKETTW
jgi:hypothetical protein